MNILINTYCNLKCPYCFADPTMKECPVKNMSIKDFRTVLNFLRKNGDKQVRLIGGEPTLSPNLEQFIDTVIDYDFFDNILIFSNFTFNEDICNMLINKNRFININTLPNINEYNLMIPNLSENIERNLKAFYDNNMLSTIGINIYRPDMDLSQWEQIIEMYKDTLMSIRYSIAIPTKAIIENNFDFYTYYNSFEPILWKVLRIVEKYNIPFGGDCNDVPPCCFSDELVSAMYKTYPRMFSPMEEQGCGYPVVDIQPDLTVMGCFGYHLSEEDALKLNCFNNYFELRQYLIEKGDTSDFISRKECLGCIRYKLHGKSCSCKTTHLINKHTLEKKIRY